MKIRLIKQETLKSAPYPQEDKYPSKTTVREGYMFAHTKPRVGYPFVVYASKLAPIFHTSNVQKIEHLDALTMTLTTTNSVYQLQILE